MMIKEINGVRVIVSDAGRGRLTPSGADKVIRSLESGGEQAHYRMFWQCATLYIRPSVSMPGFFTITMYSGASETLHCLNARELRGIVMQGGRTLTRMPERANTAEVA